MADSAWATDDAAYMSEVNYNADRKKQVEALNADADALLLSPADANQVEDADYEYQIQDSGSSTGGSAPTEGSGDLGGNC